MQMTTTTQNPIVDRMLARVKTREAKIAVVGLGYVGLPLALLFSEERFAVTGFDIDRQKVELLSKGGSYIYRISESEIKAARGRGFRATTNFEHIRDMDAVLVCVPTPLSANRTPDLSYIVSTMEAIAQQLAPGQLIILESTTYPGTTEEVVVPILEKNNPAGLHVARNGRASDSNVFVAFSPEREDPGNNTIARRDIPKVVGGMDEIAAELAEAVYRTIFNQVVKVSTPAVAELTKLLENIYRCVNIALVNELKLLCLRMDINIWEVIEAASTKPFGFQPFYPGPGLGGHCIPVDPFYLSWKAKEWDFQTRFIELAGEINMSMPYHVVEAVTAALGRERKSVNGSQVLVLGVAYKKDIDDLRESPSLTIIELLRKMGAEVSYNDPYIPVVRKGRKYDLQLNSVPMETLGRYDCVLILTDHSGYDYQRIVRESKLVVDTRNATRQIQSEKIVHC